MNKFLYHYIIFISIFFNLYVTAENWPIREFSTQQLITGVLGEFRLENMGLGKHFHSGIDISATLGIPVYSISSGIIDAIGSESVTIGDYRYIHITIPDDNDFEVGKEIEAFSDIIGYIKNDHLHFTYYDGDKYLNPLELFEPYTDKSITAVYDPTYWDKNTKGKIERQKDDLWGKIDVRVRAKDRQDYPGSQNVGIYSMNYIIRTYKGKIIEDVENIEFTQISGNVQKGEDLVYDTDTSNNSEYYYWISNAFLPDDEDNAEDRCINTKLKINEEWNGTEAILNTSANYRDGRLLFDIFATDYVGNKPDTSGATWKGADRDTIIIDNFLPYVQSITIKQRGQSEILHKSYYEETETEVKEIQIEKDDGVDITSEYVIAIEFSEDMNPKYIPIVNVTDGTETVKSEEGRKTKNQIKTNKIDNKYYYLCI